MSAAVDVKTLTIDGVDLSARADQNLLVGGGENKIFIPTLCHLDGQSDVGACRLCLVELKNSPKLFPACVLKVEEGMEVITKSDRLLHYRQTILELLFAERNHVEKKYTQLQHNLYSRTDFIKVSCPSLIPWIKTRKYPWWAAN